MEIYCLGRHFDAKVFTDEDTNKDFYQINHKGYKIIFDNISAEIVRKNSIKEFLTLEKAIEYINK